MNKKTATPSLHGLRVEIPRRARRDIPLAADITLSPEAQRSRRASIRNLTSYLPGADFYGDDYPRPTDPGADPNAPDQPPTTGGPRPPARPPTQPRSPSPPPQPITTRTVGFNFTNDANSDVTTEVRLWGPIPNPFRITAVHIVGTSGVTDGQYVFVNTTTSNDLNATAPDAQSPTIWAATHGSTDIATDNTDAFPITEHPISYPYVYDEQNAGRYIKCLGLAATPAVALPHFHVIVTYQEFASPNVLGEPWQPRDLPSPPPQYPSPPVPQAPTPTQPTPTAPTAPPPSAPTPQAPSPPYTPVSDPYRPFKGQPSHTTVHAIGGSPGYYRKTFQEGPLLYEWVDNQLQQMTPPDNMLPTGWVGPFSPVEYVLARYGKSPQVY